MTARILVVDDEPDLRGLLGHALKKAGYLLMEADSVMAADRWLERGKPDLILLDWMLPGLSGIQYLRHLRITPAHRDTPVILLTARSEERDKVTGLESGADDYLAKPFSMNELLARVAAVLRRSTRYAASGQVLQVGELRIAPEECSASYRDQPLHLSVREFRLLYFLLSHPNRIYSRAQILDQVWGENIYIGERVVDVYIRRVRATLEPHGLCDLISTVRGVGYRAVLLPS